MSHRLKGDAHVAAASRGIARLARISDWADSRHNVFLRLSEIPLLFTLQLAYAAESWRRTSRPAIARLGRRGRRNGSAAVARRILVRAPVVSISGSHRSDTEPLFEATEVAHPLLPAATAVSELVGTSVSAVAELRSRKPAQVLIVSGSNMSGKSTLMRTVGINAVLALAGAPVRAESFA